jgi:hypothetical protein
MYAAIRRGKANPGSLNELARRIQDGLVPTLRNLPGFVAYDFVNLGNDEGIGINVFETQDTAEEANRLAADWARQNLADISPGPPQTSEGECKFTHTAANRNPHMLQNENGKIYFTE